jgi:hypothetical protein
VTARLACGIALTLAVLGPAPAAAQQFHLYLQCTGKADAGGKAMDAHLDLALRDNNMTALVQRSNVLPVGERMQYVASPLLYTMTMGFMNRPAAVYDWLRGTLWVWQPDLRRLNEVRLSIDRQSAALDGVMLNAAGEKLGVLNMTCTPRTNEDMPKPRF